jgi:hypothetical protein
MSPKTKRTFSKTALTLMVKTLQFIQTIALDETEQAVSSDTPFGVRSVDLTDGGALRLS